MFIENQFLICRLRLIKIHKCFFLAARLVKEVNISLGSLTILSARKRFIGLGPITIVSLKNCLKESLELQTKCFISTISYHSVAVIGVISWILLTFPQWEKRPSQPALRWDRQLSYLGDHKICQPKTILTTKYQEQSQPWSNLATSRLKIISIRKSYMLTGRTRTTCLNFLLTWLLYNRYMETVRLRQRKWALFRVKGRKIANEITKFLILMRRILWTRRLLMIWRNF